MLSQQPFNLLSQPGARPDIRITRVTGPLTIQHVFAFQDELRKDPKPFNIIDLTGAAYLDSAGMGSIINFYVSAEKAGRKLTTASFQKAAQGFSDTGTVVGDRAEPRGQKESFGCGALVQFKNGAYVVSAPFKCYEPIPFK